MDLLQKLKEQGWYITEEGLSKLSQDVDKSDIKKVIQTLMDMDFREVAGGALPSEISRKDDTIAGRVVLQISKIRNISAPKANEESKAAPRLLHLELTDGVNQALALEFEHISTLSLNTPPGTKVYLKTEKVPLMQGILVLRPHDVVVLGGKVSSLVEKWELSRTLLKYARGGRRMTGSSGPPPWIPFGQKIQKFEGDKNFKSLTGDKEKETKDNNEFDAMRSEAIAEAAKTGAKKIFGGGNQQILDHNVKKIIEKGFTEDEAKNALRSTRNNLERALYNLKRREEFRTREESKDKTRPANKRGFKESKKSRDEEVEGVPTKPAANVSLFDFLTGKLPANSEGDKFSTTKPSNERPAKSANEYPYQQAQYQSQNSIPSSQSNRPKFENNISSSFASRSNQESDNTYKGRSKNLRGGGHSGTSSYSSRQGDTGDKYRDSQRSSNYNRNQRPNDRSTNYSSSQQPSTSTNDSRNRNGYDKSKASTSTRYPQKESSNFQQNNKTYSDNRQSNYSEQDKMNKLTEDTSRMKIDNKSRNYSTPRTATSTQKPTSQPQSSHMQQQPSHNIAPNTFTQLPNGFAYDPNKIMGFQNKETNEFAMTMLKNQSLPATIPPAAPAHTPYTSQSMQILQQPTHQQPPQFMVQQQHPNFGMNQCGDGWNWKIGDRCLAKYWDDGRYYEAEITGQSDKTCVILFLGYGNYEEVLKTDCLPITDAQHRPINFNFNFNYNKMHENHPGHPGHQTAQMNRGASGRYRGERQMYVPPPKRES